MIHFTGNPTGGFYTAPAGPNGGWRISKALEIYGDGIAGAGDNSGSTLHPASSSDPVLVIDVPVPVPPATIDLSGIYIHDLKIKLDAQPGAPSSTGNGIQCITGTSRKASYIRLARLRILNLAGNGLHFEGVDGGDGAVVDLSIEDCTSSLNLGDGLFMKNVYQGDIRHSGFLGNRLRGCYASFSGVAFYQCSFDGNSWNVPLPAYDANLRLTTCHVARVDACHFENFGLTPPPPPPVQTPSNTACVFEDCGGCGVISGCFFVNASNATPTTGITIPASGNGPILVLPNRFRNVATAVNASSTDLVVLPQMLLVDSGASSLTLPTGTDNNGFLGLIGRGTSSISRGLTLPRMTTTQRDSMTALAVGMLIFNSTLLKVQVLTKTSPVTWVSL